MTFSIAPYQAFCRSPPEGPLNKLSHVGKRLAHLVIGRGEGRCLVDEDLYILLLLLSISSFLL